VRSNEYKGTEPEFASDLVVGGLLQLCWSLSAIFHFKFPEESRSDDEEGWVVITHKMVNEESGR
jgi:hypothetical protein